MASTPSPSAINGLAPSAKPAPCVVVIFGASGDLTKRKLIPALYDLDRRGQLPRVAVLGISRTEMSDERFRDRLRNAAREFAKPFSDESWSRFAQRLHYLPADATDPQAFPAIAGRIEDLSQKHDLRQNVLFYLSVAPSLYVPIIDNIHEAGLVSEGKRWCSIHVEAQPWQRVIVEKPFGTDLSSARAVNRALGRAFEEESIYRIDHYLGKEIVQNLLVLRFANTIFEPLWNRRYIDHVQITAAETVGVGTRGDYYDEAGATRDMIQSHLVQVLALVAMEAPNQYRAADIRREKIKVTEAIRVTTPAEARQQSVFGQYGPGPDGKGGVAPGYRQLPGVDSNSITETYAAIRLDVDNWRWSGVPFYLRTGKALARKLTEIAIFFRQPPADLFRNLTEAHPSCHLRPPNRLLINIQPDEGISLRFEGKIPGEMRVDSIKLDFDYLQTFGGEPVEAYGPLILDAMRGDQTLFKHRDEVEGAWTAAMPFIDPDLRRDIAANIYAPSTWGPAAADRLMEPFGRHWHNPVANETR